MLGVFIVGVVTGVVATIGVAYIIGKTDDLKALPPYDPDNDPDED